MTLFKRLRQVVSGAYSVTEKRTKRVEWSQLTVRSTEIIVETTEITAHLGRKQVLLENDPAFQSLEDSSRNVRPRRLSKSGNVLSSTERASAIALFGNASDTSNTTARAVVLRVVAEDQDLYNAEFNRAFVLMQYFGYLRRYPNDLPDSDYSGYDFWLTKLNQFNGNFINAEMVKAFISSTEYRERFTP